MPAFNYRFDTAHGPLLGVLTPQGLATLYLYGAERTQEVPHHAHAPDLAPLARDIDAALARYFDGVEEHFSGIPLHLAGTDFQRRVWEGALRVPWGQTATYGELTTTLGLGRESARAVGAALGANPVCLLVPCHRFLGADGSLTGYAGGLAWKRRLLEIEGALLPMGQ